MALVMFLACDLSMWPIQLHLLAGQFNRNVFLVALFPSTLVANLRGPSDRKDNSETLISKHFQFVCNSVRNFPVLWAIQED